MNKYLIHVDDYGRSPKISEDILSLINDKKIHQVSTMIGFVKTEYHELLKKKKINIRLHLNLTDSKNYPFNSNKANTSFFKLILLSKKNQKYIFNEIEDQVNQYKKIYNLNSIKLDGHEHVHFIPWIYNHLLSNKKYNIIEMRYPVESFHFINLKYFFHYKFIRNLLAWILLNIFSIFNKKKTSLKFYGIIFSNFYSKEILNTQKKSKSKFYKEILLHTASTHPYEKYYFSEKYYDYFSSSNRKIEKQLLFDK